MLDLIYDRTAEDVANGTDKGYYRYTDLNRVQAAVLYLRERFGVDGYDNIPAPSFRTWSVNEIPRFAQMNGYLAGIWSLTRLIPISVMTIPPISMNNLDWRGANAIEDFLTRMDEAADRIEASWFYCGEVFSGEVDM